MVRKAFAVLGLPYIEWREGMGMGEEHLLELGLGERGERQYVVYIF